MINDLEKEWKVILLERGKSGVKLTSDGTKLLPYAKSVCVEYEKLQMEVDELNGLQSGLYVSAHFQVLRHIGFRILSENFKKHIRALIMNCFSEIIQKLKHGY